MRRSQKMTKVMLCGADCGTYSKVNTCNMARKDRTMHIGHHFGRQCHGKCQLVLIFACMFILSHTAIGKEGAKRKYTLAEENIQHAKKNLPQKIVTQDPTLTRQVHTLYVDCLFDKFWEPALPGRPYR